MSQLGNDPQQNYRLFLETIQQTGKVWGVTNDDGWIICDSEEFEDTDVIPFWSDKADAQAQCCDEWAKFEPQSIDLVSFVERWLPGMAEDGVLLGPNWNSDMTGLEIEPAELADELLDEA
ncbi:DUF2750 domain-containing protein [Motiliproteus coralliicola]|uniref:DUF2750 domain-containing protein n=1 Tax=Motiliproteus coralliicola TaxID=2283196 RepID=A0A369WUR0_9GAMM|nr:DUF2750 domain-containing protein [Motiliproteus coralliicola]RDE25351.1 DUF2750 domain-containing protein [Motiliproteus coralliicola]